MELIFVSPHIFSQILVLFAMFAFAGAAVIRNRADEEGKENLIMSKAYALSGISSNQERHSIEKRSPQVVLCIKTAVANLAAVWGLQFLPTLIPAATG